MPNQDRLESIRALDCPLGSEYDEETFLYVLAIERARADRSNRPLPLLLATLEPDHGKPIPISPASAAMLFGGLRLSLRDTDIMGWYRQGRVVGAVLGVGADEAAGETSELIEQRIGEGLREQLPSSVARGLRVRVTHHGPRQVARPRQVING